MKFAALSDLATLHEALLQARRDADARAAAEAAERERVQHERSLFARSVGPVHALADKRLASVPRPRRQPVPRQRELDEQAVLRESVSDEIDVESLLDTDESLSFRRPPLGADVVRKLRRGHWALQGQVDLHGLRRDAARERLAGFLREAARSGLRCVRVIHGKGNGSPGGESVLRNKVRGWLVQKDVVLAFVQARASDGGRGALMVLLRPGAHGN